MCANACLGHGLLGCSTGDFAHDRRLVVMPLWNLGHHTLGVENAGFINDVARFDAGGFFYEIGGRVRFGL